MISNRWFSSHFVLFQLTSASSFCVIMPSWGEFVAIYGTAPIDRYIAWQSMSPMSMQLLHNTVFWVNCKCTEFCWKRSLFINVTVYKVNKAQWDSEILPMSMAESSFYVEHICSYQHSSSCNIQMNVCRKTSETNVTDCHVTLKLGHQSG